MADLDFCGRSSRIARAVTSFERALIGLLVGLVATSCGDEPSAPTPASAPARSAPRTAKPDVRENLLGDLAAVRHASDGGGRAWVESLEGRSSLVVAGTSFSVQSITAAQQSQSVTATIGLLVIGTFISVLSGVCHASLFVELRNAKDGPSEQALSKVFS